jgi:hypothetical protein
MSKLEHAQTSGQHFLDYAHNMFNMLTKYQTITFIMKSSDELPWLPTNLSALGNVCVRNKQCAQSFGANLYTEN